MELKTSAIGDMATSTIKNPLLAIEQGGTGGTSVQTAQQALGLAYKAGDKDTMGSAFLCTGHINADGKTIWVQIPMCKSMEYVTPSITNLSGLFRGAKGFLNNSDAAIALVTNGSRASGYTVTISKLNTSTIRIVITRTTAFSNFQASSDIQFQGTWTIAFS